MKILLLILIAYLLGSIQTGLWIGKVFFHTNLREHGSGNTGTTNTFRVLGKTAGTITFLVDMLKGTLAVLLPVWLGVTAVSPLIIGFFAIIGHVFPIFASFKGGKAVLHLHISVPSPEVTAPFCLVPSPEFSQAPWYSLPDHLCRFGVRFDVT